MQDKNALSEGTNGPSGNSSERYLAYLAGGLFSQHELASNVSLKEAVWRLSNERFELVLPQSKELRQMTATNLAANLRNADLQQVLQADILIARFDGPELDTGSVVEFMVAKMLGKPSVIIRSDSRHITGDGLDDPFNLMVKNWPRTEEVYIDSLIDYIQMIIEARMTLHDSGSPASVLEAELEIIRKGVDALAVRVIEAMSSVIEMESPYPAELRELVYEAFRYTPGASFDELITEDHLDATLQELAKHHTL